MTSPVEQGRPLLEVRDLVKWFRPARRGGSPVRAVDGVSFTLRAGETLALVGETGCGKSTIAKTLVRLVQPTSGAALLDGTDLFSLPMRRFRRERRRLQMVFQDPTASLNPRRTVRQLVSEAWALYPDLVPRAERRARGSELLDQVSLSRALADAYPHQLSGGQRQRVAIARALAVRPDVVICDEPVSSLDASIQAQILNLLGDLQAELGLSYVFITHDLGVASYVADRVAVMHLGRIVETGTGERVFARPVHPYTQALVSAHPDEAAGSPGRRGRITLVGDMPSPAAPPSGCRFRTRCWLAEPACAEREPELASLPGVDHADHTVACHFRDRAVLDREAGREHHADVPVGQAAP